MKLFCNDCQSTMCERCESFHRKIPACRNHSTVPIESQQEYRRYAYQTFRKLLRQARGS